MDIVTKKHLNILIQLAEADKHFAREERDLIYRIAARKNFPESEVDHLLQHPEPIESLGALSRDQKFEYLFSCVELIFADQKVMDSELVFSKIIALKLGFKKSVVDFLVKNYGKEEPSNLKETVFREYF